MRIFLSHARVDKPLVRRLQKRLPPHVRPWLDADELYAGQLLSDELRRAILDENDFLVVFVSAASLASPWVQREVQWALERETDLQRTFVVPVLLPGAPPAPADSPLRALWDRLYIACSDDAARSVSKAGDALAQALFALVSEWIETRGDNSRRRFIAALRESLTRFKDLAYLLQASMGAPLAVLGTRPEAHAQFAQAVTDYNAYAQQFIQRKDTLAAEVKTMFGGYMGAQCSQLLAFIEEAVYRGGAFKLNAVRDWINAYETTLQGDAAALQRAEQEKARLLGQTQAALDEMTSRSLRLVEMLEAD